VSGLGLDGGSSSGYGSSGKAERDYPSTTRPVDRLGECISRRDFFLDYQDRKQTTRKRWALLVMPVLLS